MSDLRGRISGQTLKHLRGQREVRDVAELAGVPAKIWQLWESGEQVPPDQYTAGILRGLDCSQAAYEQAYLTAAQTIREFRRADALRGSGVPAFEELANAMKSVLYCHLEIYDALERITSSPTLLEALKRAETPRGDGP